MSYSSVVLSDSPIAYYRQGDPSGTTMTDSSGNARHGSYDIGTPTLGTTGLLVGDADTAVTFPGSARGLGWADDGSLDGLTAFTVEAWIKPSVVTANPQIVTRDGTGDRSFQFCLGSSKLQFIKIAGGVVTANSATTLTTGTIYHVVGVFNATDIRLYINGALDGTPVAATGNLGTVNRQLEIADRIGGNFFNGVIDEVAVYNTALSAARVLAHYNAGLGAAASGTGSLSLSASGAATAPTTGTGSLSLSGSGAVTAPTTGTGSLTLSGAGVIDFMPAVGTGSLDLSGSGAPGVGVTGSGSLSLSGSGTAVGTAAVSGTGSLTLSATGGASLGITSSGFLTLSGEATAEVLYATDTSNLRNGRRRFGLATVTVIRPVEAVPVSVGTRVDKALAYPTPTMVDGRPT